MDLMLYFYKPSNPKEPKTELKNINKTPLSLIWDCAPFFFPKFREYQNQQEDRYISSADTIRAIF